MSETSKHQSERVSSETGLATVFLAIEHPLLRYALIERINASADMTVVGEADNGETALESINVLRPNAVLIQDSLQIVTGLEIAAELRKQEKEVRIVLLVSPDARERLNERIYSNADAILYSDDAVSHILHAIRTTLDGRSFVCPLLGLCNACDGFGYIDELRLATLSELERDILGLMAEKKSAHRIARDLDISYASLQRHRELICRKLSIPYIARNIEFVISRHAEEMRSRRVSENTQPIKHHDSE